MNDEQSSLQSGRWRGFYVYASHAVRHRMELDLTFAHGAVRGDGSDGIGAFTIAGSYDDDSREVHWRKRYVGRHTVLYRGFHEGKGIWGTWEIPANWTGGFKIWPAGSGDAELERAFEAIEAPAESLAVIVRRQLV